MSIELENSVRNIFIECYKSLKNHVLTALVSYVDSHGKDNVDEIVEYLFRVFPCFTMFDDIENYQELDVKFEELEDKLYKFMFEEVKKFVIYFIEDF